MRALVDPTPVETAANLGLSLAIVGGVFFVIGVLVCLVEWAARQGGGPDD